MFRRHAPVTDPVPIRLDGRRVTAQAGEPVAAALLAARKITLARSTKLHRPRGPFCFRGECDGCLARVDGVPNIMTCTVAARAEMQVETQNTFGSRKTDLLRLTDWFFPDGVDHHHLLVGVPGASAVMTGFARQLAGVGQLPDRAVPVREAQVRSCDVLVVGGGPSGIALASMVSRGGAKVILCDDGARLGGSARPVPTVLARLLRDHGLDSAEVLTETTAMACYPQEQGVVAMLVGTTGALRVTPRFICFATGAHDPTLPVGNGDLPGILSARSLCLLYSLGISASGPLVIVGDGRWGTALAKCYRDLPHLRVKTNAVAHISGRSRVTGVVLKDGQKLEASVVAVSGPLAPAFELGAQAGAQVSLDNRYGYRVEVDEDGRASPELFGVGECTGSTHSIAKVVQASERTAQAILKALATPALPQ